MGAHESPAQTMAAVEADAIRLRAATLVTRFDDALRASDDPLYAPMGDEEWSWWQGVARAVLAELARG